MQNYELQAGSDINIEVEKMKELADKYQKSYTAVFNDVTFNVKPGDKVEDVLAWIKEKLSQKTYVEGLGFSSIMVVSPGKEMTGQELIEEMAKRHLVPLNTSGLKFLRDEIDKLIVLNRAEGIFKKGDKIPFIMD